MNQRNLSEWISELNQLHIRSIDLEFGRIQHVAHILKIARPSCLIITVAGTNGKGSIVGFLESFYSLEGYKVAAYTSPYLISFNEQFRFCEQWISDQALCHYFEKIEKARGDIILTFFEFKTLAAFLYFSDFCPDIMILEVGLGGRLDSVNLFDADISVISSIGLDHCEYLGNTRESIGKEKAGIFRKGKYAVCGDINPPLSISNMARELEAKILYRNQDFYIKEEGDKWSWYGKNTVLEALPPSFLLKDNIATALQVIELSSIEYHMPPRLSYSSIASLVAKKQISGRLQLLSSSPFILLDVSHNEDSVMRLRDYLVLNKKREMTAVFSLLKTKDISAIINIISPYIGEWHIAELHHPQAMSLSCLEKTFFEYGVNFKSHDSIIHAYQYVLHQKREDILVFGSFHVVGDVLKYDKLGK